MKKNCNKRSGKRLESYNLRTVKGFRNHVDLLLHFRDRGAEREKRAVVAYLVSSRDKVKI